ncbi:aspartyl protease family protein [Flavobacterium sp.]|uniref:aspartyl protease family protein n=1 Tax=Flavobacterium sp. TaxID=239 RepID=UPI002B4B0326|nr:aspartyl protease family protein [Flavobacterium sp.]HLF53227.1 aspartyl protease family protein [Flavobacterium sp.]
MKNVCALFFLLIFSTAVFAQDGFQFQNNKNKIVVPFELINNLIFIPIKVNGVELNFLLDTGVNETILFSLEDKDEVRFYNVEKIKLRGLGIEESIEGLKSSHNTLSLPNLIDTDHEVYIVLDQEFNFSSHIGIPVNGIIGYDLFKNYLVEIDYDRKKVIIYKENKKINKRIKKQFSSYPISIEEHKPYLFSSIEIGKKTIPVKLLLDSGNSDAVWLFVEQSKEINIPSKNFNDFLGRGFSGEIYGKRARISNLTIDKFKFEKPIVAFPNSLSTVNVNFVKDRVGSIGGEIFKRFVVIFDYKNSKIFLKKGRDFDLTFNYNMSGIEIQHQGLQWVEETVQLQTTQPKHQYNTSGEKINNNFKYKFILKPIYSISSVRKDSPADVAGLKKDDIIISINKLKGYKYSLEQISSLLKSEDGKWIEMEIERNNMIMKFKFQLKSML